MAAVLACGDEAVLSHDSAAVLWRIRSESSGGAIHVSVPAGGSVRQPGIVVHRRSNLTSKDVTRRHGIPVTTVICTLVDLAAREPRDPVEAAVNEADKQGFCNPEQLRSALDAMPRRPGVAPLRKMLDYRTFVLSDSQLERFFLPIARRAGLGLPQTRRWMNSFRVDFYWPELRLLVETDGLRYHRTAAQQAVDRVRDQQHTAAGLTCVRFTHAQIRFEPDYVEATLGAVAEVARRRVAAGV
jgi:very-short-patch-repair endonuclease